MSTPKCPRCGKPMHKSGKTPGGKIRYECRGPRPLREHCYTTTLPSAGERKQNGSAVERVAIPRQELRGERFVITWAQNATPVHREFFACLQTFCRETGAQLLVIPGRYKNPTSQWTASQANNESWAEEVQPYLIGARRRLNDNLTLLADLKIQPTAVTPLTGFEGLTGPESGIVGHPKLQYKTVPTPANKMAKILTTTGAVTVRNYTDSRAGKGGEFHHVFGAVLVEIVSNKLFHLHQINYSTQGHGFVHGNKVYYADRVEKAAPYKALVFGDAHARFADPTVVAATFGKGGLVDYLNPELLVYHDLLDAYAVNPHHCGDPFKSIAKHRARFDNIRDEVEFTIRTLLEWTGKRKAVIVPSNHDDMLRRWVVRADWKTDPVNAEFYLETALHMVRATKMTSQGAQTLDPFQFHVEARKGKADIRCIPNGASFCVAGIELALHGDEGPNGARGTIKNLARIGTKVISGHGHAPAIEEGHYRTGTMTPLKLEYTGPVSNWLNTHCSIDQFGKRHLHTCIGGRFWL